MFENPPSAADVNKEASDIERSGMASSRDVERVNAETEAVKLSAERLMASSANDPETAYEEATAQKLEDVAEYIKVHHMNKESQSFVEVFDSTVNTDPQSSSFSEELCCSLTFYWSCGKYTLDWIAYYNAKLCWGDLGDCYEC